MLNTEEVIEIVGYVCNRCFLGQVTKDLREPCEFCQFWNDEAAAKVQLQVKKRMTDVASGIIAEIAKRGF